MPPNFLHILGVNEIEYFKNILFWKKSFHCLQRELVYQVRDTKDPFIEDIVETVWRIWIKMYWVMVGRLNNFLNFFRNFWTHCKVNNYFQSSWILDNLYGEILLKLRIWAKFRRFSNCLYAWNRALMSSHKIFLDASESETSETLRNFFIK